MPIPIGPPPAPVQAAVDLWHNFGVIWHGCDGSTWDLVSLSTGVVVTPDGIKGLNMPGFDRYSDSSPSQAGSRFRGSRTQDRKALWPIFIYGGSTGEWIERDRAFWKSMRPDEFGTWEIVSPEGTSRFLNLYFADDNDKSFGLSPAQYGWSVYAVDLIADDLPYWYGEDIVRTFNVDSGAPFFAASPNVFTISPGDSTGTATIDNPGDVDAWPVWTITNDHAGAVLGVGPGSVQIPAMVHGEIWTIDTRPNEQSAIDALGADRSAEVVWNPAPVPRGQQVPLSIAITSPDSDVTVECALTPLHFRAW